MNHHFAHREKALLRPARDSDMSAVAEIWHQGWRDGHLGHVPDALAAARTEESFRLRAARRVDDTVVAEAGGEIAGFVMVSGDEVEQVYVAAPHRGSGMAADLLAEAARVVAAGGHERAWLAVATGNARARRFYERNGWTDEGAFEYPAADDPGPPIPVPCHRYVKELG
ncbi:N-acetyltransferase family protein [Nonomuraea sp. NPDC050783]|uniref:GNAT family N-acetyltransferase n=1 Tax=Nonomuraea sp. NPDC050783 TaxID=3154634 RepID=UPI003466D4B4